jgi:segregation and condensation protein B
MARGKSKSAKSFDRELTDLPNPLRRREFMMRIEAVLFASPRPVSRETLSSLIGGDCHLDQLIADIRDELRARPYELVAVAGEFAYRTRPAYADAILASGMVAATTQNLSQLEGLVVTAIGYFQPITRAAICDILGKPVSRDILLVLRRAGLIAAGPRSPQPGAPATYVTTKLFLERFGLDSLRDLPDFDRLEDAGLLGTTPLPDELRSALGISDAEGGADAYEDRGDQGDEQDEEIAAVEE